MGADVVCIKDMANLLLPYDAYSLVKKLKENIDVPIHLHTHNTTGTGDMTNLMAATAGVDIVDCALSPLANGTSQPATDVYKRQVGRSVEQTEEFIRDVIGPILEKNKDILGEKVQLSV